MNGSFDSYEEEPYHQAKIQGTLAKTLRENIGE